MDETVVRHWPGIRPVHKATADVSAAGFPVGKPFGVEDSSRDGPFDLGENFRLGLKWVGSYADSCHPGNRIVL